MNLSPRTYQELMEMIEAHGSQTQDQEITNLSAMPRMTQQEMDDIIKDIGLLPCLEVDVEDEREKLTDVCRYEDISPCPSYVTTDKGTRIEYPASDHDPELVSDIVHVKLLSSQNLYDFSNEQGRSSTCQTGRGEPKKKRQRRKADKWDSSEDDESESVAPPSSRRPDPWDSSDEDESENVHSSPNAVSSETVTADPAASDQEDRDPDLDAAHRPQSADFPSTYFEVTLKKTRSFKHKKHDIVNEYSYQVTLKDQVISEDNTLVDILPQLRLMFTSILEEINLSHNPYDIVRIYITHADVKATNIIVGPDYLALISAEVIMNHIADVIHSNNFIPANKGLSINVAVIRMLQGMKRLNVTNVWKDLVRKGCIIGIDNQDNYCLPRAIAVAIARQEMLNDRSDKTLRTRYNAIRQKDRKMCKKYFTLSYQKTKALKMMHLAGIPLNRLGLLSDVPLYERALQVGVTVISARSSNKKVYRGNETYKMQIILYHTEGSGGKGHFSVLTKIAPLLNKAYYCNTCDVGFDRDTKHKCGSWCNVCGNGNCIQSGPTVKCSECNAPCRSDECLQRHVTSKSVKWPSKCRQMFFCPTCDARLKHPNQSLTRNPEEHMCGESFCTNCQIYYWDAHQCYMRSTRASKAPEDRVSSKRFIFYDFESMLAEDGQHVPNLVVAHSICSWCEDVTHVSETDKCHCCGTRCVTCSKWNRKERQFELEPCDTCGFREVVFRGLNTVSQFCSWLISEQHTGVTALAHNARSYDSYFIYEYIISNGMKPQIIFRGAKIMHMQIKQGLDITFLDSLNFMPMALAALPKSFGLTELKKGFFPHLYNHQNIVCDEERLLLSSHVAAKYYDPDNMSEQRRSEFFQWYEVNKSNSFDFHAELLAYCRSDVDILLNACWRFRSLVALVTGPEHHIDAYDYITMASLCMGIFRSKFLAETWTVLLKDAAREGCLHNFGCSCSWIQARKVHGDAELEAVGPLGTWHPIDCDTVLLKRFASSPVAILPVNGYGRRDNFSKEAMEYIKWFEKCYRDDNALEQFSIRHAQSPGGEKEVIYGLKGAKLLKYRLDGYFKDSEGREHALEFYGCWFHGCPRCYPRDRCDLLIMNKSMTRRHADTLRRADMLRKLGYELHEMWSCDFHQLCVNMPEVSSFIRGLEISDSIDVRQAYYGGRTNAITLKKNFTEQHKGLYADFCSLYPDVLKYNRYPVGHAQRVVQDFDSASWTRCDGGCQYCGCCGYHLTLPYFGLMKVKMLPPKSLLLPVLPVKIRNKLMFPLCAKCSEEENQSGCECPDADRAITNTWCTPEIEVALNLGYVIVKTYEVLHWPLTEMFDKEKGSGGLFTDYINCFLRIKAQASGYPTDVLTEEDRKRYISDYALNEGVHLHADEIESNPGLRSLAKLALNSFYGKFGQKGNMNKCAFVTEAHQIFRYLTDYSKTIRNFHLISESMVALEYSLSDEFCTADPKTNVAIAAFCTCHARLKLWFEMNKLGGRVVYHDTDSIIYSQDPAGYNPPLGKYLGQLTDELSCKSVGCKGCPSGHWIAEFVSCGAKNYAYKLNTGEVVCKVRGFCLNYSGSKVINLTSMTRALESFKNKEEPPSMITVSTMILRKKMQGIVYSKSVPKHYGMVYNKRILLDDYTTVPYGYAQ